MPLLFLYIFCAVAAVPSNYANSSNNPSSILESVDEKSTSSATLSSVAPPPDVYSEEDEETERVYYALTIYSNNPSLVEQTYMDLNTLITKSDDSLVNPYIVRSFKKAANAPVGFPFLYYGHPLQNLTISSGGFCYTGDTTHSWLASQQYIAPLMAEFDLDDPQSSIQYATDRKTIMLISWNNVTLRGNRDAGFFNFQVHLHVNGDIYFVYKNVPLETRKLNDVNHPVKVGISDAYLYNHKVDGKSQPAQRRRVLHKYNPVSVSIDKITSGTILFFNALPTCPQSTDCKSCSNSELKAFECSWCRPNNSNVEAFCLDQAGLRRRREDNMYPECAPELLRNQNCTE